MIARAFVLAGVLQLVSAFSDTTPVISWSSHSSGAVDGLHSTTLPSTTVGNVLNRILNDDSICAHDAVILINQPGLHASDLRALSPSSSLSNALGEAPSSFQYPYARRSADLDIDALTAAVSARCGAQSVQYTIGHDAAFAEDRKHVVCVDMPSQGSSRGAKLAEKSGLSAALDTLTARFPNHIVILTGTSPTISRRQRPEDADPFAPALGVPAKTIANANATLPTGGILKRYQLLTPGLITSLIVAFFLLVPIVMLGLSALSSIQSPLRMEAPKGFSAQDRKNK